MDVKAFRSSATAATIAVTLSRTPPLSSPAWPSVAVMPAKPCRAVGAGGVPRLPLPTSTALGRAEVVDAGLAKQPFERRATSAAFDGQPLDVLRMISAARAVGSLPCRLARFGTVRSGESGNPFHLSGYDSATKGAWPFLRFRPRAITARRGTVFLLCVVSWRHKQQSAMRAWPFCSNLPRLVRACDGAEEALAIAPDVEQAAAMRARLCRLELVRHGYTVARGAACVQ